MPTETTEPEHAAFFVIEEADPRATYAAARAALAAARKAGTPDVPARKAAVTAAHAALLRAGHADPALSPAPVGWFLAGLWLARIGITMIVLGLGAALYMVEPRAAVCVAALAGAIFVVRYAARRRSSR